MTALPALVALAACAGGRGVPTVDGPEDPDLLARVRGYVLVAVGGLGSISMPERNRRLIIPPAGPEASVHAAAGPDEAGRIAYVLHDWPAKKFSLKVASLDGSSEGTITEGQGDGIYEITRSLALSSSGGTLAFLGPPVTSYVDPGDTERRLLEEGFLQLWSLDTRAPLVVRARAVDRGVAAFPRGERIAYTALLPRARVDADGPGQAVAGGFEGWERIPAVMILDLATDSAAFLHAGWQPVVSPDGRKVLVSDARRQYTVVSLETRQGQSVVLPGGDWHYKGAVAFVGDDLVLYRALPTTGARVVVEPRPQGTLKVADIRTGRFKTVLAPFDPIWEVSFGPGRRS